MAPFFSQLLLLLCMAIVAGAQGTLVHGRVTDAANKEPLSFVSVTFPGTDEGISTDEDGYYELKTDSAYSTVQFSIIGYKTVTRPVMSGKDQTINIALAEDSRVMQEVVVKPRKFHYHNKNNPAVALIDLVVANRDRNRIAHYDYATYQQYEKMVFSLSNSPEKLRKNLLLRRYKFITANLDTVTLPGKALLPLYIQEATSDVYYRRNPEHKKTVIYGEKRVDYGEFVDNEGLNQYMHHLYQDVDIYDNNINLATNQFLSPIANLAPTLYKYFITDTIVRDSVRWVELSFFPRNKADMLFQGKLYVTLDGRYAVPEADMYINKDINLDWVKTMHVVLDFDRNPDSTYQLSRSTVDADFGITKTSKSSIFGKREVAFKNYVFNKPAADSFYLGANEVKVDDAEKRADTFWTANRQDTLTAEEQLTYRNVDSLNHLKSWKRTLDIIGLLLGGYKQAGRYFEIGPVGTFYSGNPIEGLRLRFGGRTTPHFSKHIYLDGYGAYGFKDERWKYYGGITYSLNGQTPWGFPNRLIKANYQRDTKIPGQALQFVQEDNVLLSFKRGINDKYLYNDTYNLEFIDEFRNHFSYDILYKNWKQEPAGALKYIRTEGGVTDSIPSVTTSEIGLTLRWAPHEQFYSGKQYRTPILNKYPVFTLRINQGLKGFINGEYNYTGVTLNITKHIYLSQFGYTDIVLEGANIFGQAPYPLLEIHHANQTYGFQLESYNLMNFLEFVSDHYASLDLQHGFNGFFFNKIPLISKLRWREFLDFKILYGGIRDQNNPVLHASLLQFPTDTNGRPITFALGNVPYIEAGVGIGNIFKVIRVELVKRFTYLDNPNISSIGIRARARFDF